MKTSLQLHNLSTKSNPNNTRRLRLGVVAGLILVGLWFGLTFLLHNASAIYQKRVEQALNKPNQEREKELKILSFVSGRNQIVQRALADYYLVIQRGDLAAESLASAQPSMLEDATNIALSSYSFDQAETYALRITQVNKAGEWQEKLALAQLNLNKRDQACKQSASNEKIRQACTILESSKPSRQDAYRLLAIGAPIQAEKILSSAGLKSTEDYLTLAAISERQGSHQQAVSWLSDGFRQDPFSKLILQAIISTCKLEDKSQANCHELLQSAEQTQARLLSR